MKLSLLFLLCGSLGLVTCWTSVPVSLQRPQLQSLRRHSVLQQDRSNDNADDSESSSTVDWREFRARLVMNENRDNSVTAKITSSSSSSPSSPNNNTETTSSSSSVTTTKMDSTSSTSPPQPSTLSSSSSSSSSEQGSSSTSSRQWAYDAGDVIEQGSIILSSNLERSFGHGLMQQYFHKSVILVLEHEDQVFTKGIILNRPTDIILTDEDFVRPDGSPLRSTTDEDDDDTKKKNQWRLWFGGDVQTYKSGNPELICLHSLQTEAAMKVSKPVFSNNVVQFTSFEQAYRLVQDGEASCDDFWLFGGYAGWGPGQLQGELTRHSWYMVATDAGTVWDELRTMQREQEGSSNKADAIPGADTWTRLMERVGHGLEAKASAEDRFDDLMLREWGKENLVFEKDDDSAEDDDLSSFSMPKTPLISAGTLLRGSSATRSPFMLNDQGFHKSVILVVQDEEQFTIGLLLNRPLPTDTEFSVVDRSMRIAQRFGGRFGFRGLLDKPVFWLHNSQTLRDMKVGSPIGREDGIWRCTKEQVQTTFNSRIAGPEDFICVEGLTVWPKMSDLGASLAIDVSNGLFEVVSPSKADDVWSALSSQEKLTTMSLDKNLLLGEKAWAAGASESTEDAQEDVDELADSDEEIASLCDDALRGWVAAFQLGEPIDSGSDSAFE